jgi:hypothetical protein
MIEAKPIANLKAVGALSKRSATVTDASDLAGINMECEGRPWAALCVGVVRTCSGYQITGLGTGNFAIPA